MIPCIFRQWGKDMGNVALKNRRGGVIVFGDINTFNAAYWRPVDSLAIVPNGDLEMYPGISNQWVSNAYSNFNFVSGPLDQDLFENVSPVNNNPFTLEIPENYDAVPPIVADILLVEPGQNTASDPGYFLRVRSQKIINSTNSSDPNIVSWKTYTSFELRTIATNISIADIYPYTDAQYMISKFSTPSTINYCRYNVGDLDPKLLFLNDGTNLYITVFSIGNFSANHYSIYGGVNFSFYFNNSILKNVWNITDSDNAIEDIEISPEYGNFSTAGGYKPSFDDSSDTIPVPNKPSLGVTTTGFQNVYVVTASDIASIGSEIFPVPTAGTDVLSALNSLIDVQSSTNLSNYVVDCRILPVEADHSAVNTNISIAGRTLNSTGKVVTDDYVDVDCGSVTIPERYGNFADYEPYTTAKLYLPFVGFVPVHIEFLKKLQVKYRFNVIDGSFVVYVLASSDKSELNESVVGQYAGCACIHIPFSGLDYANFNRQVAGSIVGTISGVVNTAAGLATGNPAQATKGGAGIISGISQGVSAKPDYQQSNSYTGSTSFMTVRTPYLLIGRPEPQFSENYPKENGLPLNVKKTLSGCSGLTVCGDVIVSGINCTDIEKEMIVNELKAGVIL